MCICVNAGVRASRVFGFYNEGTGQTDFTYVVIIYALIARCALNRIERAIICISLA